MRLPDVDASRAVLIGTAHYGYLETLPAVAGNLDRLGALLRDPEVGGLPKELCAEVLDPGSATDLLDAVHRAAREATDLLLVYYAGHALVDDAAELLLTVTGSDTERLYRSVPWSAIRREVRTSAARSKVVILDCPGDQPIADLSTIDGAWVLTAGTDTLIRVLDRGIADGPPMITADALYLRALHEHRAAGRAEPGQRMLGVRHDVVIARNRASPGPPVGRATPYLPDEPYLRLSPAVLAEQVAALRTAGHGERADAVLAGSGRRRADQEVASIMAALAAAGRARDVATVAFAAAGRDPRELRRIYEVLLEIDEPRLATGLLKVAAEGLPESTARFVAVLAEPGPGGSGPVGSGPGGSGPVGSVPVGSGPGGGFAGAGNAGSGVLGDAGALLLRAAAATGKGRPGRLVDLLNALHLARRAADAELLLTEAQRVLPAEDLAVVADALRDGGRDAAAGRLYSRATSALVGRDPAAVAAIAVALHAHGPAGSEEHLVRGAVAARAKEPPALAELIAALEAAGLSESVAETVSVLGARLPRPILGEVTRALRARGCEDAALRLYLSAAADRPVDEILRLGESLTEQGRPMDALNLLVHAARVRSVGDLDRMTDGRTWPVSAGRNRRIFAAVADQRVPERAAALYRTLARHGDGRLASFRAELLRHPDPEIVAVAARLLHADTAAARAGDATAADRPRGAARAGDATAADRPRGAAPAGDATVAADLLRGAVREVAGMTPQRLAGAAVEAGHLPVALHLAVLAAADDLPAILERIVAGGDPERRLAPLLAALPRRAVAGIVAWFCGTRGPALLAEVAALPADQVVTIAAAAGRAADDLLALVATGRVNQVRDVVAELRRGGERAHLRTLVDEFRERHPDGANLFKLAGWLWALDEHDLALLALRGRLWAPEATVPDAAATAVAAHLHDYAERTHRTDLAWPRLAEPANAADLAKAYQLAPGETPLLVLSFPRRRRLTPVLFTERAVHHVNGARHGYRDLHAAAGRRNAVVLTGPSGEPADWDMPSAAAAEELIDLLAELTALTDRFPENVRDTTVVHVVPVPDQAPRRYELEGELS